MIDDISDYIKAGKKVQAVKLVRESMGLSLKESKQYVDRIENSIKNGLNTSKLQNNNSVVSVIDGMEGHQFEYFCAELLRKVGFVDVTVTRGSGDQGVDILAVKDGIKYAIQCKNYASTLGNTPVQEVSAGKQFYGCHVGVVMTNSTFTSGAIQLADANNVLLWDRKKLDELILSAGGPTSLGLESDVKAAAFVDSFETTLDEILDEYKDNAVIENNMNKSVVSNSGSQNQLDKSVEVWKNKWISLMLCVCLGMFGAHRFYEKKITSAIIYLFTFGLFGIGWLYDIIILLTKTNPYRVK